MNHSLAFLEPSGLTTREIIQLTKFKLPLPGEYVGNKMKKLSFWDDTVSKEQRKGVAVWVLDQDKNWQYSGYELAVKQ